MPGEIAGLDLGYTLIEVPELGRELVGPTRSQLCYIEFGMPDLNLLTSAPSKIWHLRTLPSYTD
jgi:hypothetical protein